VLVRETGKRKSPTHSIATPTSHKRNRTTSSPAVNEKPASVETPESDAKATEDGSAEASERDNVDNGASRVLFLGQLRFGQRAASIASDSNSKIDVHVVLIALHKSGQLQKEKLDLANTQYLEITQNNKSKYKAAMRLVEKSWTAE
jgi:hypothetical protein